MQTSGCIHPLVNAELWAVLSCLQSWGRKRAELGLDAQEEGPGWGLGWHQVPCEGGLVPGSRLLICTRFFSGAFWRREVTEWVLLPVPCSPARLS